MIDETSGWRRPITQETDRIGNPNDPNDENLMSGIHAHSLRIPLCGKSAAPLRPGTAGPLARCDVGPAGHIGHNTGHTGLQGQPASPLNVMCCWCGLAHKTGSPQQNALMQMYLMQGQSLGFELKNQMKSTD